MKRYGSYKESGFEWIGIIPSSWELIRGKFVFKNKKEINKENQELNLLSLTLNGVLKKDINSNEGLRPKDYSTYQIFEKEDLVFKLIDLENTQTSRVGLVPERGIMSPVYIRLEPQKSINSKYSYYYYYDLYKQHIYNFLGSGVRSSLTPSNLLEIELPLPPLSEQQKIVSFLDTKTSSIDSLIKKTQRKIELLKEKRNSLINEIVTKGLNPDMEMKDSGVEWIGKIPTNWVIKPLYTVCEHSKEKNEDGESTVLSLSYGKLKVREVETNFGLLPESFDNYQRVRPGYIILRLTDLQNDKKSLRVGHSSLDGIITPVYVGLRCNSSILSEYLYYHLHNSDVKKVLYSLGGGLRQTLRFDELKRFPVPVFPIEQQQQIVSYLDEETQKIDNTISLEEKRIELLKEYRQSLISEVVTGKRKVVE